MPPPPTPVIQSFHSYDQLARLWPVARSTITVWVSLLRREAPHLVYVSYRLRGGYRRTAYLAGSTVAELQRRHFPRNAEQPKRRGAGRESHPFGRPSLYAPPVAASSPAPPPPHESPASAAARAPWPLPLRRLTLPPIPRREENGTPLLSRAGRR